MMTALTIYGRLPSLNDVTRQNRAHWSKGAKQKKMIELFIAGHIYQQNVPKFGGPVHVKIKWYEKNLRRDRDNIQSATKFILDALIKTEIIKNDSQKWLKQLSNNEIYVDKDKPRVEVWISETWIP